MSLVRWIKQEDGLISDVYIFYDVDGGITCMSRLDSDRDFNSDTEKSMLKKLKEEYQDHHIPEFVFKYLENSEKYDKRYL